VAFAAWALVRLTSRGPGLYWQRRVGLNGREFTIYKLRTMVDKCESITGPRWCIPGDPRITPLGAVLRKLHVDELPQLWNVIAGDMSLIGPRPERPEFVVRLREKVANYDLRHQVTPGITGLAQVQLPPDTEVNHVEQKVRYDLYYVTHLGAWLDIKILACTALKVVGVPMGALRWLMNIGGDPWFAAYDARLAARAPRSRAA
jgi:lipopolysaccharide/colanic/teichoic acid biosynthesis glycosyltransferase